MKTILITIASIMLLTSCSKDTIEPNQQNVSQNCISVQCLASTQTGARCSRTTTYCNGLCWQHQ